MSAREFQRGELVDVVIKGARVQAFNAGYTTFAPKSGAHITIETGSVGVDITRVAPREWPPQPGDVWEDAHGGSWWACLADGETHLKSERGGTDDPSWVLDQYGPMRLAYRRGWTPETAPAAEAEPEKLDKRAEVIAGLREMADWFEANPEIPLDLYGWEMLSCISKPTDEAEHAELLRIAELVGEPADLTATHPGVRKEFRGRVGYRAYYIPTAKPADKTTRAGEVAGPVAAGPVAAPAESEHYHSDGVAGGAGENGAGCACGVFYGGFDSQAEAVAALEAHIADVAPLPRLVEPAPITDPALNGGAS